MGRGGVINHMHFDPCGRFDHQDTHLDTAPGHRPSHRLGGLQPEFGPVVIPPRMMTSIASQTNQCSGASQPLIVHSQRTPRSFYGGPFDDVEDWLEHFDRVAAFNDSDDNISC